jgi:tetratricopeptide (TPR) repeat protein
MSKPEAVDLFCQRSRLEPDDVIGELCDRLDDMPLAVELAAARTNVLTPKQILDRLAQRLDLLKGGRDADPRQHTLRATIGWSYHLLDDQERRLFTRLAVFAGGCTLESAEEICNADLETLQSLVDKSLIRRDEGDIEPRFAMLETIREYALDRLAERPEADELRRRHAEHLLALMETTEPELRGPEQPRWIQRLETEHDNLRTALRWLLDVGEADLGLRLAAASSQFWYMRGLVSEGRRWLGEALELASPKASEALASGLDWAGYFAAEQGDDPIPLLEASRRCAHDAGALATAALATAHLSIFLPVDRAQEMLPLGEEAVRLARASGVRWVLGVALNVLGETLRMAGYDDRATAMYEEGLVIRREMGDVARISLSLSNLSEMAFLAGDLSRAHGLASEALDLATSIGDRRQMSFALADLGWIALEEGRPREARELFVEGLELERALGTPQGAVAILHGLAGVAAASGDVARGARLEASAQQLETKLGAEIAHVPTIADSGPHEPFLNAARDATEHAAWELAWAVGAAMDLDEAIDSALSED